MTTLPNHTQDDSTATAHVGEPLPHRLDIDAYGMTHPGKVRTVNQDHFLISSLRKHLEVNLSSIPDIEEHLGKSERLAFFAMVADGVGGGPKGEEASRLAIEMVQHYVREALRCYYTADATDDEVFAHALEEAAARCHVELAERSHSDPELRGMATTLTLWIGVWPTAYLLHVGDSRCYIMMPGGDLTQVSRDQTMAQELIDAGVMTRTDAMDTRWANVLSSSLGGPQSAPVVTRVDQQIGMCGILCSDGLTKHVSDEQIADRLRNMTSAKQACEALVTDALEGGGSDNVTVLVGRLLEKNR